MFSHVMVGANDVQASKAFYDASLAILGHDAGVTDEKERCFYFADNNVFALTKPINGEAASNGNGFTLGFSAKSAQEVDAWYKAGLENGGTACEDAPGIRQSGERKLYLAYLRDPSGNKVCAMFNAT